MVSARTASFSVKSTRPTTLSSLPVEVLEHIAFYYVCPRVLGPPIPLATLLLLSKAISYKLSVARHLYARVFKHKFSFSAIRRRGFEPRAGEWAWQLRRWCEVLKGVRSRRRRPVSQAYVDDVDAEEAGVQETMYALWIMCLEDDGCNRAQMQLVGAYEWVEGYIRTEMYKNLDKGWPLGNAGNSCAMWVFWYLSSKARLMDETPEQRESLIDLIIPFLTVPFRYPSSFAPANHFRLPLQSSAQSSLSTPFSIPTPHGPFPIYLHPSRHTWVIPHFDRWTPLCTPLAADAAKLVYFSRRETMLFNVPDFLPRNREEHRARVRTPLPRNHDPWDDVRNTLPNILDAKLNRLGFSDSDLYEAERIFDDVFDESECSSRCWDADWWRLRLCRSAWVSQSAVYTPGSLNGLWTGRMIEAGHRPNPFTETTLGLVAVPLYVRLSEYAMYAGGSPIPCANDTDSGDRDESSIQDAWFPPNTTLSAQGDHVIVSVPSSVLTNREEEKYEYVAVRNNDDDAESSLSFGMGSEAEARNKRKPGTFHDRETCTGCIAREKALVAARARARGMNVENENPVSDPLSSNGEGESLQDDETINDLPPYVPSAETLPPCNGIRDVLITGNTDPRHAAAWGNWVWKGRVRKWDGMVGLVRSANNGVSINLFLNS
ncbi:hypothetical protein F5890DRAFT_1413391 [Lentinula detonsa]|uniref:F-box domain-containing protein n=1 Tax=Lentinula detonsa TaxID=2804962 RepID=A0AA38PXL4_9AGAR|nr:hypothetical protein F5890DRAFT_1413391 [Lentinula detonsa]